MIIDIRKHNPSGSEHYLLDTNIWLFLYCPIGNYGEDIVSKYSFFYNKLLKAHSTLYTTSLILSEFINAYLRMDCKINKIPRDKYKIDYRPSPAFSETFKIIEQTVKGKILNQVKCLDDEMSKMSFDQVLHDSHRSDFNDAYVSNLVKDKGINMLTDDHDFSRLVRNHKIFTGNPKSLRLNKQIKTVISG